MMRIGALSLAFTLIGIGVAVLLCNLGICEYSSVLRWWPVVLVALGAELLIRQYVGRGHGGAFPGWDRVSVALVTLISLFLAAASWLVVGPGFALGMSWAHSVGLIPTSQVERRIDQSAEVPREVTAVEVVAPDWPVTKRIQGGSDTLRAELHVFQAGRTEEEARRLASEWRLNVATHGDVIRVQAEPPSVTPSTPLVRGTGSRQLVIHVPSRLKVKVGGGSGLVEVIDVAGCEVVNRFGDVQVNRVPGPVKVTNEHGAIRIEGDTIRLGNVTVENGFGPVRVSGAKGPLTLLNRHGEVSVEWADNPTGDSRIENEFGLMRVVLLPNPSLRLDVETRFGKLNLPSSLPLNMRATYGDVPPSPPAPPADLASPADPAPPAPSGLPSSMMVECGDTERSVEDASPMCFVERRAQRLVESRAERLVVSRERLVEESVRRVVEAREGARSSASAFGVLGGGGPTLTLRNRFGDIALVTPDSP